MPTTPGLPPSGMPRGKSAYLSLRAHSISLRAHSYSLRAHSQSLRAYKYHRPPEVSHYEHTTHTQYTKYELYNNF